MMEVLEREAVSATLLQLATECDGEFLTASLDEFGWGDLYEADPAGAVEVLFLAQGRTGSWSSALHDLLALASPLTGHDLRSATVLIPQPHRDQSTGWRNGGEIIDGLMVGARSTSESVVVAVGSGAEMRILQLPRDSMSIEAVKGLDQRLTIFRVTGSVDRVEVLSDGEGARRWWATVVAAGRRAVAFDLCGTMESMLGLAVSHAKEREQFGRPVGTFQAVRHRLAECLVACSGSAAMARASFPCDDPELASLVAKLVAGRAQKVVGDHCQQVLAGIGFTAQHPFHNFLARAVTMDRLFGSATELAPEAGRMLMHRGGAVRLVEL
jgi:Acyl-CoA dehydrogenase, C-terminal domain